MPVSFVKSIALTILIIMQMKLTDITLSYIKTVNLPVEIALFISLGMFILGAVIYQGPVKKIIDNYQSSQKHWKN